MMESTKDSIIGVQSQMAEIDGSIISLKSRARTLTATSPEYLNIRRQFIDVFKKKNNLRNEGHEQDIAVQEITPGTIPAAHGGDALADALLYRQDARTDWSIYRELYGLEFDQVLEFGRYTHAVIIITSCQVGSTTMNVYRQSESRRRRGSVCGFELLCNDSGAHRRRRRGAG